MERRIVILGAGESGTGAAVLARKQGFDVFVTDSGRIKDHYKEILFNYDIEWEEGKHTERLILNADEVIKSPGITEKSDAIAIIVSEQSSEISFCSDGKLTMNLTPSGLSTVLQSLLNQQD